jgi:peptidoglycan/LPS O-acetylase OafA/YrhL
VSKRHLGLDYLRGFVVLQVVAIHAAMAYSNFGPILRDASIIRDSHNSFPVAVLVLGTDAYFMSLMFFHSGLFVGPSLARKGAWGFVRARGWRLGWPLVLGVLFLMPPTYYAWALWAGARVDPLTYWRWSIFSQPLFPLGPLWFLLVLLVFDLMAATLYRLAPGFLGALGRATSRAAQHPLRFCVGLVACGTVAYFPLLMIFGPNWILIGRLDLQYSRLLLYGTFFFAGVGVGAWGIERGLLGRESMLVRRWPRWVSAAAAAQFVYLALIFLVIISLLRVSPLLAEAVSSPIFVWTATATGLAVIALFQRFARPSAIFDSLSANSFGIYVVHQFFVFWAQYLMIDWDLPGIIKVVLVVAVAVPLSWLSTALLRRVPLLFERGFSAARRAPGS